MIAFVCSISSEDRWRRFAHPGIERVAEPDSLVIAERGAGSFQARLNRGLEAAAARADLEAVVLIHDDAEILDPEFLAKVRHRLEQPGVAVIGAVGAQVVKDIAWWDGHPSFGGVRAPLLSWANVKPSDGKGSHVVDTVDGLMLVLSAWAARELRFDEEISDFHGYDSDICFQARARGRRVVVEELDVAHHSRGGIGGIEPWIAADHAFRRKWGRPSRLWR